MAEARFSDWDLKILAILDENAGFLTRRIAEMVHPQFGHNRRTHSGAVRAWLVALKRRGFVDYLDDQKPVCWKLTPRGSAVIRARQNSTALTASQAGTRNATE